VVEDQMRGNTSAASWTLPRPARPGLHHSHASGLEILRMDVDELDVTPLPALGDIPPPLVPEDYGPHRGKGTALVIDNGSSTIRFGFAGDATPRTGSNTVSRYKERKTNRPMLVFGEAVEVESAAKTQIRTPWEGDVLLNFDALVSSAFFALMLSLAY
jgi:actin-related protein 5